MDASFRFRVGAFRDPPGVVGAEAVLFLEPVAAVRLLRRPLLPHQIDPFVEGSSRLLFQFSDPLLHHGDAGMNAVERFLRLLAGSAWHAMISFLRISHR